MSACTICACQLDCTGLRARRTYTNDSGVRGLVEQIAWEVRLGRGCEHCGERLPVRRCDDHAENDEMETLVGSTPGGGGGGGGGRDEDKRRKQELSKSNVASHATKR
jgi:hypothetical protein